MKLSGGVRASTTLDITGENLMASMIFRRTAVVVVLMGAVLTVRASDVDSGPKKGSKVPGLKVFDATGENKDKTVDYASLRKDRPTVYLFVGEGKFARPMFRFMKTLDEAIKKDLEEVYGVAVWLTDDEEKSKEYLPRISMYFEMTALTVFKGKDGPKGWDINGDAHLTVVVAHGGKVTARFGYNSVNETDVPAVLKELKKVAKGKK
jgi:hypothetical protein